jgi:hypothetical protein
MEYADLRAFDAETSDYLKLVLFGDKKEKLSKWEKLQKDPIFALKYQMTLDQ